MKEESLDMPKEKKLDRLGVGNKVIRLHKDGVNGTNIHEDLNLEGQVTVQTVRNYIRDWEEQQAEDKLDDLDKEKYKHYGELAEEGFEDFVEETVGKLKNLLRKADDAENVREARLVIKTISDVLKQFSKIRQEKKSIEVDFQKRVKKLVLRERRQLLEELCPECRRRLAEEPDVIDLDELPEEEIELKEVEEEK